MAKKKENNVREVVEYVPKQDNKIYIYKQKHFTKLFPIPYKFTYNYQYLIPLLNDKK